MQSRRDFLRTAATLTGSAFVWGTIPEAIARALQIDPETGTTYRDAEHVVILMQENRSFDHCYGALRGVRGYRDPRVHRQPNGWPVWFQRDADGKIHAPYRVDLKGSNSSWIGGLPHTWPDQLGALNGGHYDRWLIAKARADHRPLTMGHYTRVDLPFYYAFADAFTVCDQAFCSSLTGTTPNRLYLWTGAIRKQPSDPARVFNEETDFNAPADWSTFPERLEDAGVTWRIYQNELTLPSGLTSEEDKWLSNFGDNPLEWFPQFGVRFSKSRRRFVTHLVNSLPAEIATKQAAATAPNLRAEEKQKLAEELARLDRQLGELKKEQAEYNDETWAALPARLKSLHERAFTTNSDAPDYRSLVEVSYADGTTQRSLQVPRGDVFHRFRSDVREGKLPSVSWLVAPEAFSDHPSSAWFGAWYVSETLKILTENPEVWKKTVFILCYDENDGYFDHVPPFVAPHPNRAETGKVSAGIDPAEEVATSRGLNHSIGLGYRCPLVVASPWSRGGCVNSQVFDHTSVIQFVEHWLAEKGRPVREPNVSAWRRTVCGNLTSVFRPYQGEPYTLPPPLDRNTTIIDLHKAKFTAPSNSPVPLTPADISKSDLASAQESGTRPSCPLPYELEANGVWKNGKLHLSLEARNRRFGALAAGAPFNVYSYGAEMTARAYAVKAGDQLEDSLVVPNDYRVRLNGPNGFSREFRGSSHSPSLEIFVEANGDDLVVRATNRSPAETTVTLSDRSYGAVTQHATIARGASASWTMPTEASHGWYDFSVDAGNLSYRYSGRVETGRWSISDPAMV